MWPSNFRPPGGKGVRRETKVVKGYLDGPIVEQTHDGFLAMWCRRGGDAKVKWSAVNLQADATVLWQTSLGDVQ